MRLAYCAEFKIFIKLINLQYHGMRFERIQPYNIEAPREDPMDIGPRMSENAIPLG